MFVIKDLSIGEWDLIKKEMIGNFSYFIILLKIEKIDFRGIDLG